MSTNDDWDGPVAPGSGRELFVLDDDGERQDAALHAEILDDPEADEEDAADAVTTAMAEDGLTEADALALYGTDKTPARLKARRGT